MEIWKDIVGYEGIYQVSNFGVVKRVKHFITKKEFILKGINNGNNYLSVNLSKDGKKERIYIHRIVCIAFLENPDKKDEVNHIDGIRTNNNLTNLEWVTRSENHFHRYKVLKQKGVNYGKKGILNWRSKPVNKLDLNNNIIETYPAVMEAMRITGIQESCIRACIYGRQKTAGGFKWSYV
jgi:hypothetical protein